MEARFGRPGELIVPEEFALSQNYPNPFNSATRIEYSIAKVSDVTIRIYDLLGHVVSTYKAENVRPGYYSYTWSGKNESGNVVSSGIYFYRLEASEFIKTNKMMLLK